MRAIQEPKRLPYPKIAVDGIFRHRYLGMHFDVNGKWGGKRAVVAHFAEDGYDVGEKSNITYLYILVGGYGEVGKWPGDDPDEPSAWEIAKLVTTAMEEGANKKLLYRVIEKAITGKKSLRVIVRDFLIIAKKKLCAILCKEFIARDSR